MKILAVFGTRPEAIKLAPLILEILNNKKIKLRVCVTAQHRHMLDQVTELFGITPDYDLNLMGQNQGLSDLTAAILKGVSDICDQLKPDLILVHGDTTTAMSAALAGFYLGVEVAHIEAGLRTFNMASPFPEEFNRQVISKIAKWHFCPTDASAKNLIREGISSNHILVTGNTVIDSLFFVLNKIKTDKKLLDKLSFELDKKLNFNYQANRIVLITGHRRENFGKGFLAICKAIKILSEKFSDVHFVYPVHLNPNVQNPVNSLLNNLPNVHLIEPLSYELFVYLMELSYFILTDSGGIQEEAPSLGKPVLLMRDTTERPEGIQSGAVALVGADVDNIVLGVSALLQDYEKYLIMSRANNPYGDGKASYKIVSKLIAL